MDAFYSNVWAKSMAFSKRLSVAALTSKCTVCERIACIKEYQGIRDVYAIYFSAKTKRVYMYVGACAYVCMCVLYSYI